jgi:membrane protein required for colicin V production
MNFQSILNHLQMFDIVVAGFAVAFIIIGIKRGLIGELVRLLAIIGGFAVALVYYKIAALKLTFLAIPGSTRGAIAFIIIFIAAAALILLIGWALQKVVRLTPLGWIDHLFGALIGLSKAAFLAWIFVLSAESSPFTATKNRLRVSPAYSLLTKVPIKFKVPYITLAPQRGGAPAPAKAAETISKVKQDAGVVKAHGDSIRQTIGKAAGIPKKK